jgi:hypothetical protein
VGELEVKLILGSFIVGNTGGPVDDIVEEIRGKIPTFLDHHTQKRDIALPSNGRTPIIKIIRFVKK